MARLSLHTLFLLLLTCCCQMTVTCAWTRTLSSAAWTGTRRSCLTQRLFSSSSSTSIPTRDLDLERIAIVGGGLAGLSTAFHLLEKTQGKLEVTIFDTAPVGTKGASSVAGGLLHPLSPRGKLVHWGREGLEATNRLVDIAQAASDAAAAAKTKDGSTSPLQSPDQPQIVVRDQLYRLAVTQHHVDQFQATAQKLPEYCTWWTADQLVQAGIVGVESTVEAIAATSPEAEASATVLGGLRLHNGCRVVHVPSYLQGLYAACRERGATWQVVGADDCSYEHWKHRLQDFDAVVLSAGSGLFFQDEYTTDGSNTDSLLSRKNFPVQMVRGQSVELRVPGNDDVNSANTSCPSQAILCGKYISPMPNDPTLYTVGATHEFKEDALSPQEVVEELTKRTADFSSLWELASVERMTMGYRVQSNRGQYGRMPVIGQLPAASVANGDGAAPIHTNTWIFTGLSSRGLLFHALYGDILTDAILEGSEASMLSRCKDLTWWRK